MGGLWVGGSGRRLMLLVHLLWLIASLERGHGFRLPAHRAHVPGDTACRTERSTEILTLVTPLRLGSET